MFFFLSFLLLRPSKTSQQAGFRHPTIHSIPQQRQARSLIRSITHSRLWVLREETREKEKKRGGGRKVRDRLGYCLTYLLSFPSLYDRGCFEGEDRTMILKKEKKEKEKVRDGPGICLVPPTSLPIHPLFFWSFFLVFFWGGAQWEKCTRSRCEMTTTARSSYFSSLSLHFLFFPSPTGSPSSPLRETEKQTNQGTKSMSVSPPPTPPVFPFFVWFWRGSRVGFPFTFLSLLLKRQKKKRKGKRMENKKEKKKRPHRKKRREDSFFILKFYFVAFPRPPSP